MAKRLSLQRLFLLSVALAVTHAFTFVSPNDDHFNAASAYHNDMEYDETAPNNLAVYWTYNDADVGAALANAVANNFSTIVGKSAGHSYVSIGAALTAGQAIIDVSNITGFSSVYVVPCENARPDPDGKCRAMWVGPGARLYDVYTYLNSIGYIYPGGSCPIVGISGYALGGGIGFWGRYLGYGTDAIYDFSLWSVQNGKLLNTNKDWVFPAMPRTLRWALQGGGNNNFGIVGNLSLRVFKAPPYVASWVVNSTNTTFCKYLFASRWQYWNWQSDERLWAQYSFSNPFYNITEEKHARLFNGVQLPHWTTFAQSTSVCTITFILMNGTTDELYRIVTDNSTWNFLPIMDQLTFNTTYPTYSTWYDQICGGDLCSDLRPAWQHHWTQGTYSAYQFQDMSDAQVDELFAGLIAYPDPNTVQSFVLFDSLGGQFSRGTGSLPWHAAHYHAQILYYLWPVGDRGQKENGWVWASGVGGVLDQNAPQPQGSSYVNYPDWSYASPQLQLQRYYGPNLPTLQAWKKFLDPGNLFPSTAGVNLDGTLNALGKAATPEPLRDDDDDDDDSLFGKFFNAVLNLFNALF